MNHLTTLKAAVDSYNACVARLEDEHNALQRSADRCNRTVEAALESYAADVAAYNVLVEDADTARSELLEAIGSFKDAVDTTEIEEADEPGEYIVETPSEPDVEVL